MEACDLARKKCRPCEGGVPALGHDEAGKLLQSVKDWKISGKSIEKELTFGNFMELMSFVNKVAGVAESEGHHPDLWIHQYKNLKITLWTHAVGGLTENDFILAAKIDAID